MKPLTERRVAQCLMRSRWRKHFCLYNYTPRKWWECDVFEITKAQVFREYEIKLTRADFFNDMNKDDQFGSKHNRLHERDTFGPQRFWFVTPAGLLQPHDLPSWCGLIEITTARNGWLVENEVIAAPRRHTGKLEQDVRAHAERVCYYRMHNLFRKAHH